MSVPSSPSSYHTSDGDAYDRFPGGEPSGWHCCSWSLRGCRTRARCSTLAAAHATTRPWRTDRNRGSKDGRECL